jgi:hypothetical protein
LKRDGADTLALRVSSSFLTVSEEILSFFAVSVDVKRRAERAWLLRVQPDIVFGRKPGEFWLDRQSRS